MRAWTTALDVLASLSIASLAIAIPAFAAGDVDISGKWTGTWTTPAPRAGAPSNNGPCTLTLVQSGKDVTGEIYIGERPAQPPSYTAPVHGTVKETGGELTWTPLALGVNPYTARYEFTLKDGTMTGGVRAAAGLISIMTLKRSP